MIFLAHQLGHTVVDSGAAPTPTGGGSAYRYPVRPGWSERWRGVGGRTLLVLGALLWIR